MERERDRESMIALVTAGGRSAIAQTSTCIDHMHVPPHTTYTNTSSCTRNSTRSSTRSSSTGSFMPSFTRSVTGLVMDSIARSVSCVVRSRRSVSGGRGGTSGAKVENSSAGVKSWVGLTVFVCKATPRHPSLGVDERSGQTHDADPAVPTLCLVLACANHTAAVADDPFKYTHLHILHIAMETPAVVLVVVLVVVELLVVSCIVRRSRVGNGGRGGGWCWWGGKGLVYL
jgi:hypothetical protein